MTGLTTAPAGLLAQFRQEVASTRHLQTGTNSAAYVMCPDPSTLLSQLSEEQQRYYLFFRKNFLAGGSLRGDLGYVTLLAQEIINGTTSVGERFADSLEALFLLLFQYAHTSDYLRSRALGWLLCLNATCGDPLEPKVLAALLLKPTRSAPYLDLVLDGVLHLAHTGGSLGDVDLHLLFSLTDQDTPMARYTSDKAFVRAVTNIAVATFFTRYSYPGGPGGQQVFAGWVDQEQRELMVPPFEGLLHPHGSTPMRVTMVHTYREDIPELMQRAVRDIHLYALYLAGATDEPEELHGDAMITRASASKPLEALIKERLPIDLHRHIILAEEKSDNAYTITIEDTQGLSNAYYRSYYESDTDRYERVLAVYRKHEHRSVHKRPKRPYGSPHSRPRDITELQSIDLQHYFYWRTRWREGSPVEASAHLLTVYAAEVINLVGFNSPQAAYDELCRLVDTHHEILAWWPRSWLVDFARLHEVSDTPNAAALRVSRYAPQYAYTGAVIAGWLEWRDYSQLDHGIIQMLTRFSPHSAKYYARSQRQESIDQALIATIKVVADHFTRQYGQDVFDHFMPRETWSDILSHNSYSYLFGGVTHNPKLKPTRPLLAPAPMHLEKTQRLLENALKYTENTFREREKIPGKRRIIKMHGWIKELRAEIDAAIAPLLEPPKPRPQVLIDPARLAQLEHDSAHIRERLIDPAVLAEAEREAKQPAANTGEISRAVTVVTGVAADEYTELVAALNEVEERLLTLVMSGANTAVLSGLARAAGAPLDLLVEAINERALDTLGDNIIDAYENPPAVMDEYRAGVRRALEKGRS